MSCKNVVCHLVSGCDVGKGPGTDFLTWAGMHCCRSMGVPQSYSLGLPHPQIKSAYQFARERPETLPATPGETISTKLGPDQSSIPSHEIKVQSKQFTTLSLRLLICKMGNSIIPTLTGWLSGFSNIIYVTLSRISGAW